ncbi:hypothetical protein SLA2020_301800 [Shorea laevis]
MADPSMYNFFSQSQPSAAKPTKPLGGHQNAHKHERAAALENFQAANQQQYHRLPQFPAYQQQQPTSSIPFLHSPDVYQTAGAAVFVEKWLEPIQQQPHQHLPSSSVRQSFLGVSTANALSPTTDVDDSANMDLTLCL